MHVLITAASRHGATEEIAQALGRHLTDAGFSASIIDPGDVTDLAGFDAVVLGSAVYAGHWLAPATELVARLGEQLSTRPVWLFSSGPVGDPPKPEEPAVEVADIMQTIGAHSHEVIAGRIDKTVLGFAERGIVRALRVPQGDFRDWAAVERWADEIAASLHGAPA